METCGICSDKSGDAKCKTCTFHICFYCYLRLSESTKKITCPQCRAALSIVFEDGFEHQMSTPTSTKTICHILFPWNKRTTSLYGITDHLIETRFDPFSSSSLNSIFAGCNKTYAPIYGLYRLCFTRADQMSGDSYVMMAEYESTNSICTDFIRHQVKTHLKLTLQMRYTLSTGLNVFNPNHMIFWESYTTYQQYHCKCCDVDVVDTSWNRHLKTKSHIKKASEDSSG